VARHVGVFIIKYGVSESVVPIGRLLTVLVVSEKFHRDVAGDPGVLIFSRCL
jgi:hypothetical protein